MASYFLCLTPLKAWDEPRAVGVGLGHAEPIVLPAFEAWLFNSLGGIVGGRWEW